MVDRASSCNSAGFAVYSPGKYYVKAEVIVFEYTCLRNFQQHFIRLIVVPKGGQRQYNTLCRKPTSASQIMQTRSDCLLKISIIDDACLDRKRC